MDDFNPEAFLKSLRRPLTTDPDFLTMTFEAFLEKNNVYDRLKERLEVRMKIMSKRKGATWHNETFEEKYQRERGTSYEVKRLDKELQELHMEYEDEMSRRRMQKEREDSSKIHGLQSSGSSWFPSPDKKEEDETEYEREQRRLNHISEFGH